MALYRELQLLREELKKVESDEPGNWLGHWAKSIRMKNLKLKISDIELKLLKRKSANKDK